MPTTTQRLLDHWIAQAETVPRQCEPWLTEIIDKALAVYTYEDLKRATDEALKGLKKHERHTLPLQKILRDPKSIDAWLMAAGDRSKIHTTEGNPNFARFYLKVPFRDKEKAKEAGARWDACQRQWYVDRPSTLQLAAVRKWLPPDRRHLAEPRTTPPSTNEPPWEPTNRELAKQRLAALLDGLKTKKV